MKGDRVQPAEAVTDRRPTRLTALAGQVRGSAFVRHNAIFFVGSLAMGVLNYLYYPVMGRLLRPTNFGEVQSLFSLFAQITIFLNVLSLLTVNIVANYLDEARRNRVIAELEKLAVLVSGLLLLATIACATFLQHFFKFGSSLPFCMLALAVLAGTPLTFRTGYLRGKKKFGLVSLSGIVASACDLAFSIALVLAGFGTTGAILGLALAQAVGLGFAAVVARRQGFTEPLTRNFFRLPDLGLIVPELKYSLLVLTGSLAVTGLYSIDTIAVKHYFDAHTAGLYAGISTIARIIFFLTASIAQVLLPSVRLQQHPRENRQVLFKSFGLLAVLGGGTLLIFTIFPHVIIRILMGTTYLPYANLLPRLSLVVFVISLLNLFIMYFMALRKYAIALLVILGIAVTLGLLLAHHASLRAVVDSLLYGSLSLGALLALWLGATKFKRAHIAGEES